MTHFLVGLSFRATGIPTNFSRAFIKIWFQTDFMRSYKNFQNVASNHLLPFISSQSPKPFFSPRLQTPASTCMGGSSIHLQQRVVKLLLIRLTLARRTADGRAMEERVIFTSHAKKNSLFLELDTPPEPNCSSCVFRKYATNDEGQRWEF